MVFLQNLVMIHVFLNTCSGRTMSETTLIQASTTKVDITTAKESTSTKTLPRSEQSLSPAASNNGVTITSQAQANIVTIKTGTQMEGLTTKLPTRVSSMAERTKNGRSLTPNTSNAGATDLLVTPEAETSWDVRITSQLPTEGGTMRMASVASVTQIEEAPISKKVSTITKELTSRFVTAESMPTNVSSTFQGTTGEGTAYKDTQTKEVSISMDAFASNEVSSTTEALTMKISITSQGTFVGPSQQTLTAGHMATTSPSPTDGSSLTAAVPEPMEIATKQIHQAGTGLSEGRPSSAMTTLGQGSTIATDTATHQGIRESTVVSSRLLERTMQSRPATPDRATAESGARSTLDVQTTETSTSTFITTSARETSAGSASTASPIAQSVSFVTPTHGPIAGGTELIIVGNFFGRKLTHVSIGNISCNVLTWKQNKTQDGSKDIGYAETPAGSVQDESILMTFAFDRGVPENSSYKFTYKSNPYIDNLSTTAVLDAGGTKIFVTGKDLDVAKQIQLQITVLRRMYYAIRTKSFIVNPSYRNDTVLNFITPPLSINTSEGWAVHRKRRRSEIISEGAANFTKRLEENRFNILEILRYITRTRRDASTLEEGDYAVQLGFILDGYDGFQDISTSVNPKLSDQGQHITVLSPPYIHQWTESIVKYNPNGSNKTLDIEGKRMANIASPDDYVVKIGEGDCKVVPDSFTDYKIECIPPEEEPLGADDHGKLLVMVWHKKANFTVGYVKYEKDNLPLIIGIAVGGALVLIFVIIVLVCLCRRDTKVSNQATSDDPIYGYDKNIPRAGGGYQKRAGPGESLRRGGERMRNWISDSYFRMSEYFRNFGRSGERGQLPRVPAQGERFDDRASVYTDYTDDVTVYDYRAGDPYGPNTDACPSSAQYYNDEGYIDRHMLQRENRRTWMPEEEELEQMMNDPNFKLENLPPEVRRELEERDRENYVNSDGQSPLSSAPGKKIKPGYKKYSYTKRQDRGSFTPSADRLADINQDVAGKQGRGDGYELYKAMKKDQRHVMDIASINGGSTVNGISDDQANSTC